MYVINSDICQQMIRISPERELNPRHLVYKTSALPLSYQGIISHYFVLDYHD